ncbi:MAG: AraC family transcriptional regulator ligand-binding domain-containing protein, partial [Anderseniella sp.]|jgi:AraC-like DNA-binding protein|nr:AraC family transcriptional regulator ligand-binding domain-containing protein [Anderseniella sp.]
MFLNLIREACGSGWAPEEVHFEHPRPDSHSEHSRAFDAPVYFSQPTNALLFRDNLLSRLMPASDPTLMALSSNCLVQLSNTYNRPMTLFDQISSAIRSGLASGYPSLKHMARELRVSPGAVQRELAENGTTFKNLVENLRRELGMSYLRQRQLPISEISLLLGYSELSAFSRAVKRWTGASPSTVREALRQS